MDFWTKTLRCKHERLSSTYYESISCPTPYCSGEEVHCLECGAYISRCGCGFCNGISGWPNKRYRKMRLVKKPYKKQRTSPNRQTVILM